MLIKYANLCVYHLNSVSLTLFDGSTFILLPSIAAFKFYRGRTSVYLRDTEAHCRRVAFENFTFHENKLVHIHVSVNYFNTSGLFTHEAAVAWTEDISHSSFTVCALTAGRLYRIPPDGGLTFVDFIAYQGNPLGSVTGHEVLDSWWDGTTCKEITLPEVWVIFYKGISKAHRLNNY